MKTLHININNEQFQSNEEFEVLKHDLDSDFFFYLGEKIAKGCNVENENALITDFNTQDNEEGYKSIIAQWTELKNILFSDGCDGKFEFTLPNGYIHWLRYSEKYNSIYERNFSHGEPAVIMIDLEELYEDSVEDLQRKILRKLQRDDLYREIDELVFNDNAVTRKSPIVHTIKEKYDSIGFKSYKKWIQENEDKPHTLLQVCEKCKKNPCECNTVPISLDNFFPYKGFILGETSMNEFEDDLIDDGSIIHYELDNGVTFLGATESDTFIAAAVDSTMSSNNKLPKEWSNILGCIFGTSHKRCCKALSEKGFEIIFNEDVEIAVVSPSKNYRILLCFDDETSKFVALLITLNECPYCNSNNFALRRINAETFVPYCTDCNKLYLPFDGESEELDVDDAEDYETLNCPNCGSYDVDYDGSDYLQYTCNECYHNWGHDETVECPECGSDDVENDGTDSMQYKCNACGKMWGDNEDVDDTDNAGNQMSEYIESFDVIIGKSTKYDVQRKGGVLVNTSYGEYKMPNNIKVFFFNNNYTINNITVDKEASNNIPPFYKQLGFYWGMPEYEFKQIFESLGFNVGKYDFKPEEIHAFKRCEKYNCTIKLSAQYDYRLGGMWDFSINCIPPHIKCD